jgi:transposase
MHLAVDAFGRPRRIVVTAGTVADCSVAEQLIDGVSADYLLADKGYDSNNIVEKAKREGMEAVIPPRKNRKVKRYCDYEIYRLRCLVENAFLRLKRWRAIATRYAKNSNSFLSTIGNPQKLGTHQQQERNPSERRSSRAQAQLCHATRPFGLCEKRHASMFDERTELEDVIGEIFQAHAASHSR